METQNAKDRLKKTATTGKGSNATATGARAVAAALGGEFVEVAE